MNTKFSFEAFLILLYCFVTSLWLEQAILDLFIDRFKDLSRLINITLMVVEWSRNWNQDEV